MKIIFAIFLLCFYGLASFAEDEEVEIADDTPVTHEEIAGDKNLTKSRPWHETDFTKQTDALGWSESAFAVPEGLQIRYKFWLDIYSKYTTDQGVLHDADNIDMIYQEIDFSPVTRRSDINSFQKERMKIKMVKDAKKEIIAMLKKLQATKDPSTLNEKERKVWDYYLKVDEKKKFLAAAGKNRLRFQLGQRDRIVQGIYFSGRYLEDFQQIFKEQGLPIELTRLAFVESSFNVLARSKVGASGLWQIMPSTAKPYGYLKNPAIDKRNSPNDAARLSAKLLKYNFNLLKSWPLAVTGYNHGPAGVLKLTKKLKTQNLADLIDNASVRKKFGFASQNFYASFLAVLQVESHAPEYLGPVNWSEKLDAAQITLKKPIKYKDLIKYFDDDDKVCEIFNPQITKAARVKSQFIPKGAVIAVPTAKGDEFQKEQDTPLEEPKPRRHRVHK